MSDWLDNLKKGDLVIVKGEFGRMTLDTVSRLTKTQIILGDYGDKYRKKDGFEVDAERTDVSTAFQDPVGTDSWTLRCLKEATDEEVSAIKDRDRREFLIVRIRSCAYSELTTPQMEKIVEIMEGGS